MRFFIKGLVTFDEEILDGKVNFLYSESVFANGVWLQLYGRRGKKEYSRNIMSHCKGSQIANFWEKNPEVHLIIIREWQKQPPITPIWEILIIVPLLVHLLFSNIANSKFGLDIWSLLFTSLSLIWFCF